MTQEVQTPRSSASNARGNARPLPERPGNGSPLGLHRVLDRERRLPQAAERLDNTLPIWSNEILIDVERLNIDAASFVQMERETGHDRAKISAIVLRNLEERGKQQNRITGSGGMLVGRVRQVGSKYRGPLKVRVGDRIATLVSLTLTPLALAEIRAVHLEKHQLDVSGHAVLFETGIAAKLPDFLPEPVAMALFDVAGAPATVDAMVKAGQRVVVLGGGGKAGTLCCVAARRKAGKKGKVIAIEPSARAAEDLERLGCCDAVLQIDARDPVAVQAAVEAATRGKMGDVVINVASVPDTETSALLSVHGKGQVLFFGMATSFTKVALGAEGIGCGAKLLFGNGYYRGHDRFSVELLRKNRALRELFCRRYG
jgi:L-erythro-3,5-diaminohexanoate dehydrogenase